MENKKGTKTTMQRPKDVAYLVLYKKTKSTNDNWEEVRQQNLRKRNPNPCISMDKSFQHRLATLLLSTSNVQGETKMADIVSLTKLRMNYTIG